uniref:VGF nerve growth factor inducible n=1 Tax=Macaca fascicularis TaxID=9541 RepID=A0A2K5WZA3_MACFA
MKALRLSASALFCLLLIKGLGAAPPGRPEAQPPPLSSEHKEPVAGDAVPGPKDGSAPEVRAARNSEPQDEGELFQGVDPRALAAVLLQALDRPASPPAPSGSQQGPAEEAAEALLTETVRSQTHSLPAPESPEPAAPPRPQTPENGPEASDPSEELEALASLLQELRDFSPSSAKRQQETAAAETETRTHTLTRVNLESPGPERVWRASWESSRRVSRSARPAAPGPLAIPGAYARERAPSRNPQVRGRSVLPQNTPRRGTGTLVQGVPRPGRPFPKARRPESALLGGSEAGERLLQQGLAQVEAGRRQAEATRQAAAQEERLADLASDLLLQYLLQGGPGSAASGVGGCRRRQRSERAQGRRRRRSRRDAAGRRGWGKRMRRRRRRRQRRRRRRGHNGRRRKDKEEDGRRPRGQRRAGRRTTTRRWTRRRSTASLSCPPNSTCQRTTWSASSRRWRRSGSGRRTPLLSPCRPPVPPPPPPTSAPRSPRPGPRPR